MSGKVPADILAAAEKVILSIEAASGGSASMTVAEAILAEREAWFKTIDTYKNEVSRLEREARIRTDTILRRRGVMRNVPEEIRETAAALVAEISVGCGQSMIFHENKNEWLESKLYDAILDERRKVYALEDAFSLVFIGGNILANQLISRLGGDFQSEFPPGMGDAEVMERFAHEGKGMTTYDIWCAWSAMMRARDTLQELSA